MNIFRIIALIRYDIYVFKFSKWRIADTFYIPITSLLLWGFFLIYARGFALQVGFMLLAAQVFISFAYLSQSGVSVQMMDDVWSRSLREILITPIKVWEYMAARSIFSAVRGFASFLLLLTGAAFIFGFSPALTAFWLWVFLGILTVTASVGMGILICAFILRLGAEYGFLAWAAVEFFIFLSAPFYPIDILPIPLNYIAYIMPYTWIFESIKIFLTTDALGFDYILRAILVSLVYLLAAFPIFQYTYEKARERGRLIRLWG